MSAWMWLLPILVVVPLSHAYYFVETVPPRCCFSSWSDSTHTAASSTRRRLERGQRFSAEPSSFLQEGRDDLMSSTGSSSSSIVSSNSEDNPVLLSAAFANLNRADQYEAVLTGLCAKLLEAPPAPDATSTTNPSSDSTNEKAAPYFADCTNLLQEMNQQKIPASTRSQRALIDATVSAQDATLMATVLTLCVRNVQGLRRYGSQITVPLPFPSSYQTRVPCPPNGQRRTIAERLALVAPVPVDDRVREIASAAAFGTALVACEVVTLLPTPTDSYDNEGALLHLAAQTVLTLLLTGTVIDNFYDVLKAAFQFLQSQFGRGDQSINKFIGNLQLPEKSSLPGSLGQGVYTGSIVRGVSRLVTVDAEREAACEAAALYAAYVLGLPCFAFRPNALEASVLVVESHTAKEDPAIVPDLLTPSGILRVLVWLMAAPAMESMSHAQLLASDPREGAGFLQRLETYYAKMASSNDSNNNGLYGGATEDLLFWTADKSMNTNSMDATSSTTTTAVRDDLLQWAFTEADLLLRANKNVVTDLSNRLASGAATMGDCVAAIEEW